jgi:hypothetical protein
MIQARPDRPAEPGILLFLSGFSLFFFSDSVADPDLWGHVRFGQNILRAGAVVRTDVYSYQTAGQEWINHEWLSEVVFAAVYDATGPTGLIALKAAAGVVILVAAYIHMRRRGLTALGATILLAVLCVPLRMGLGTIRPQLFTYVFFLSVLLLIERATPRRECWLWPAPVVLAVWANLHGGVLAGLGLVALWALARLGHRFFVGGGWVGGLQPALLLAVSAASLLINPYGAALPWFLLRTATVPRPEIAEWIPLAIVSFTGLVYVALVAASCFCLAVSRRPRGPESLLILFVTAVLPAVSGRHFPLFALALLVLAAEHVADAWDRSLPPLPDPALPLLGPLVQAGLAAAGLALAVLAVPRFACIRLDPGYWPFPARAVAVLRQSDVAGNVAVPFTWGEYAIWHLGPRVKVSIDGRRETLYSERTYQQSLDFERGTGQWDSLLKSAPTDMVLAPHATPTANLMDRAVGWRLLYTDHLCRLYVREGSPLAASIVSLPIPHIPDDGRGLCFPPASRGRSRSTGTRLRW